MIKTTCNFCDIEFFAKPSELKRGGAKYCSMTCSGKANSKRQLQQSKIKNVPNVTCSLCGIKFYKNKSRLKLSKSKLYFCCRAHKDAAQKIGGLKEIQPPHYGTTLLGTPNTYRRIAFAQHEPKCSICGYDKYRSVLQVHHKDRDRTNNDVDNLQVVCPTCHLEIHYLEQTGAFSKIVKRTNNPNKI
jgi:hypothetical protein